MSDEDLFAGISGLKQSESEIRHIFSRHINTLFATKWKIADEITDWSKKLVNQIQEYVTQQRELLEQEYTKKVTRLNTIRDFILEQTLACEQKNDTEQITQLLNQCNTLKIDLAMLVYIERPIPSIQLIVEEQLTQQNGDECNENKTEDEESQKKLTEEYENEINESSLSNLSSTNTESTNSTTLVTESTNEDDQSISNSNKLENHIFSNDGLAGKCPICFMIFPQSMTTHHRNVHVNEHYRDY